MIEEISNHQERAEAFFLLICIVCLAVGFICSMVDDSPKGRVIIKGVFFLAGVILIGFFAILIIKII